MPDITNSSWISSMGTSVAPVFNLTAMTAANLSPAQVLFEAASAYRKAQINYNNSQPSGGPYINFTSPLESDRTPSLDSSGNISSAATITLKAKTLYSAINKIEPQSGIIII